MTLPGRGFAAVVNGAIVMKTVSGTELAAKVNALVAVFGVMVFDNWTDAQIEAAWAHVVEGMDALVVPVQVVPVP